MTIQKPFILASKCFDYREWSGVCFWFIPGVALFVVVLLLSGCSTMKPVQLPDTFALAPVEAPLWNSLQSTRTDDWIHLLNTGDEALEWRLRAIDSATRSIDLQTFLWDDDAVGLTVLRHLFEAADRGVRVRLLLDDSFTVTHAEEIWDIDHHANIEYRIYNPFSRRHDSMIMRQLMNLAEFGRLNHRMHNKALIVDNQVAIVGGRNLADEYFGTHEEANFRDLELILGGSHVADTSDLFDRFWNNNWTFPESMVQEKPRLTRTPDEFAQWLMTSADRGLEETGEQRLTAWHGLVKIAVSARVKLFADEPAPDNPGLRDELPNQLSALLVDQIDKAEKELILVSAYLIPTRELEDAVERAEDRGVNVRILTNSLQSNNHLVAHSAYRKHVHRLVTHGADLHEVHAMAKDRKVYMRSPVDRKELGLHAKFMLIDDDLSFIGSANLDPRSLRLNTEMGLLIESRELNRHLRQLIALDFHPRNAWHLQLQSDGTIHWVSDDERLTSQPVGSAFQRLEDWFLSILPFEGEL